MTKQTLSIEQMQHLQELGLDTSNASMVWCKCDCEKEYSHLLPKDEDVFERCLAVKYIPAYTLQDVLDALPKMIYPFPVHKIGFELWIGSGKIFYANMFNLEDVLKVRYDKELIDAAYSLLCWAIENKFVETNKNG